jgi:hypothetical protein
MSDGEFASASAVTGERRQMRFFWYNAEQGELPKAFTGALQ